MQSFKAPRASIGDLDADTVGALISAAADVAFVIDSEGVILDLAFPRADLLPELAGAAHWLGQTWAETVSEESRPKVPSLLKEAASRPSSRWRQLNHAAKDGPDIPILYAVTKVRPNDRYVAVGRDMRSLAALQQRLVEAQMSMERDYSRLRHAETRYRVLFQTSAEPVLVVDSATEKVIEANPAATRLFGESVGRMIGRSFPVGVDTASIQSLQSLLTAIRAGLNVEDVRVRLTDGQEEFLVSTAMFRQASSAFYLMRFTPARINAALPQPLNASARLLEFLKKAADAYVLIDHEGRIVTVNAAFLQMSQVMAEEQVRGELLERWFGRSSVDLSVLMANLRQHGSVTLFATMVRGEYGAALEVEVSAAALDDGDKPVFGLAIRNVGRRIKERPQSADQLPRSVEQLKDLIGRVSLKDMVRETADVIERLCIEAALELTGDNRASAAEMLGLSRQSLYVKLRRFGMADAAEAASESE